MNKDLVGKKTMPKPRFYTAYTIKGKIFSLWKDVPNHFKITKCLNDYENNIKGNLPHYI